MFTWLQSVEVVTFISDPALGRSLIKKCIVKLMFSCLFVCFWRNSPQWARASSFTWFLDHTQRRTTVGRNPLDKWSARRRDLYFTPHNTHNIHPCNRRIRTHNPSKRAAADPRLIPRGDWDRLMCYCRITKGLPKCDSLHRHLTVDSSFNSPVREVL